MPEKKTKTDVKNSMVTAYLKPILRRLSERTRELMHCLTGEEQKKPVPKLCKAKGRLLYDKPRSERPRKGVETGFAA